LKKRIFRGNKVVPGQTLARTKKLVAEIEEMIDVKYIQNINVDMNHQTGQITSFKL